MNSTHVYLIHIRNISRLFQLFSHIYIYMSAVVTAVCTLQRGSKRLMHKLILTRREIVYVTKPLSCIIIALRSRFANYKTSARPKNQSQSRLSWHPSIYTLYKTTLYAKVYNTQNRRIAQLYICIYIYLPASCPRCCCRSLLSSSSSRLYTWHRRALMDTREGNDVCFEK